MSIGYLTVQKLRRIEEQCAQIGLRMANPKYGGVDKIALVPLDSDALPIYTRDAELFIGSLDEIDVWLRGVEWSRNYYRLLRATNEKLIARKEQDERNRQLVEQLKKA